MRVQFHVVEADAHDMIASSFVDLPSVPAVGETVVMPGINVLCRVRTVIWYPMGEGDSSTSFVDDSTPFVYIVVEV